MAKKQIIWSEEAELELISTLEFYNNRNKSTTYSFKLLDLIEERSNQLINNNYLGRLADDGLTRIIVVEDFLLMYQIEEIHIEIVSFFHTKQNPARRVDKK
jgi:plasmid stabilization system protein ParE